MYTWLLKCGATNGSRIIESEYGDWDMKKWLTVVSYERWLNETLGVKFQNEGMSRVSRRGVEACIRRK